MTNFATPCTWCNNVRIITETVSTVMGTNLTTNGRKCDRDEMVRRQKVMFYLGGHRTTHWSQFGQCHGKKWFPGDDGFKMLVPRLTPEAASYDSSLLLDDELVSVEDYQLEYDTYIPADRLVLM